MPPFFSPRMKDGWPRRLVTGFGRRCFAALAIWVCGCQPQIGSESKVTEIQELQDQLASKRRAAEEKDYELRTQAQVIQELRGLKKEGGLEALVHVDHIELAKLSGGYDDNSDGMDDGVVIYLRLIDADGDAIKATGACRVRLLDLSQSDGGTLLAAVELDPTALRPMWFGKFMTYHYSIRIPWSQATARPKGDSITAVVNFTELLSGNNFEVQQVLKVLPGSSTSKP